MQYNSNSNSSWWLGDSLFDNNNVDILTGLEVKDKTQDLIKLAGYRRAIANFVNIVTGKNVPVYFSGTDSYTDGKAVNISASLKDKDFDAAVGLALHEGSHIKLTDFDTLKNFLRKDDILNDEVEIVNYIAKKYFGHLRDDHQYQTDKAFRYIRDYVKQLLNIVEDRRIDNFIFKSAPGYKGYYHALYEKYFNAKIVDKGLLSSEMRKLEWGSYMFRICNITNDNRDLNALPGLRKIWKILDLKNISKVKNTDQALRIALDIFYEVEQHLPAPDLFQKDDDNTGDDESNDDNKDSDCQGNNSGCSSPNGTKKGDSNDDGSKAKGGEAKKSSGPITPGNGELSPRQLKQLLNAIEKQDKFLNSEIKKTKMNKTDQKKMKALEESGSEIKKVGKDYKHNFWSRSKKPDTDCIVIKKLTPGLIENGGYSFLVETAGYWSYKMEGNQEAISKGIRLGTMLGKKLKLRSEERNTKFSRLESGKIDKRLIASLGFGAERIFQQVMNDKYVPANVHISIDASGSMSGSKWLSCQTSVVAIAKAASMVDNLDIQLSYRTTTGKEGTPCVMVAYDSRVDNFKKIQSLFKHIVPSSLTPEGLTFEAIQSLLVSASGDKESYFINFSDGEPYANPKGFYYAGTEAATHTKVQVDKMRKKGIKVLSYFVSGYKSDNVSDTFRRMYGKSSANVDVTSLIPLAKTLNKLFLTK
jgi:hypothetical protein